MRKLRSVVFCIMSIALFAGCTQREVIHKKEKPIPEVMFRYRFSNDLEKPKTKIICCIDWEGNVYRGNSEAYFLPAEEFMNLYGELKKDPVFQLVKTIDTKQLQEKYGLLQQIVEGNKNKIVIESSPQDAVYGQKEWNGYSYDEEGKLIEVTLFGAGDDSYVNQDPKAEELAEWMNEVFGEPELKKVDGYKKFL